MSDYYLKLQNLVYVAPAGALSKSKPKGLAKHFALTCKYGNLNQEDDMGLHIGIITRWSRALIGPNY